MNEFERFMRSEKQKYRIDKERKIPRTFHFMNNLKEHKLEALLWMVVAVAIVCWFVVFTLASVSE